MLRANLLIAIVALAAACTDDSGTEGAADTTADTSEAPDTTRPNDPTPWIYPQDEADFTPELSAAEIEGAIEMAMEVALTLDSKVVHDLHELLFPMPEAGSGDPTGCPFYLTYDYGTAKAFYWQGECTASDGTRYSGRGSVAIYTRFQNEFGIFDGYDVNMAGTIEAPDGTFLEGSGQAGGYTGEAQDLTALVAVLNGTFTAGGPRAPDSPWLDGTRRPTLTVNGWTYVPTGGRNVTVVGGISGLDFPAGITAVSLEDLTARQSTAGATCERELGGAAGVRGPDGNWYDVIFDGPVGETPETPPALCDGCGETWFRGQEVGDTCVDARDYFGWGVEP